MNARRNREANPEQYNEMKRRYRARTKGKTREYQKIYYVENVEKKKAQSAEGYQRNKEKVLERGRIRFNKDRAAVYRYQNKYVRDHRAKNTQFAIGIRLRDLVAKAFIKYTTTGKIMISSKYGIDYKGIIEHLGPHPNTLGIEGKWHVDHIIPVSAFDLNDLEQVKIAFAPSNHRWLPAHDNLTKSSKIPSADIVPVELLAMLKNHNIGVLEHG